MSLAKYFLNTVVVAGGAWLVQLAVDVPAAYALSKLRPKFGNVVLGLMLATLMLPASALLVPTYLTITDVPLLHINLINSAGRDLAARGGERVQHLPAEAVLRPDPGRADRGGDASTAPGRMRTLWRIMLPISRPILAVVSILAMVTAWKDFIWPLLVLPDTGKQTLSVMLQRVAIDTAAQRALAGMVLASVPMVALFLVFQRQILAGLTAGSLKG